VRREALLELTLEGRGRWLRESVTESLLADVVSPVAPDLLTDPSVIAVTRRTETAAVATDGLTSDLAACWPAHSAESIEAASSARLSACSVVVTVP